jgi:hypothetical protein
LRRRINIRQPGKHRRARFRRHFRDGHASGLTRGIRPDHARFAFDSARRIYGDTEAQLFANGDAVHQVKAHPALGNVADHSPVLAAEFEVHKLGKFAPAIPSSFLIW